MFLLSTKHDSVIVDGITFIDHHFVVQVMQSVCRVSVCSRDTCRTE